MQKDPIHDGVMTIPRQEKVELPHAAEPPEAAEASQPAEPAEVADSVLVAVEEDFAEPGNMSLCVGSVVTALISGLPQKVIYPYTVHPKMAI